MLPNSFYQNIYQIKKPMINDKIDLIYRFKDYPYIQVTSDSRYFNTKTGREKKVVTNCRSHGIWLTSKKFVTLNNIESMLEPINVLKYSTVSTCDNLIKQLEKFI